VQRCTITEIPGTCTGTSAHPFQPVTLVEKLWQFVNRVQVSRGADRTFAGSAQATEQSMQYHDVHVLRQELGNSSVHILRKMPEWHVPFWDKVIAPAIGCSDMLVESWLHGSGAFDNQCSAFDCTLNANGMHFSDVSWDIYQDHSKWALCCSSVVVCIGDMNREYAQAYRGGLAICLTSNPLQSDENGLANAFYGWLGSHLNAFAPCRSSQCTCNDMKRILL
jgi:hypothetical protein